MAERKITRVVLVIDRSGSMSNVRKEAWTGINEQINALKASAEKGGETYLTLVLFDGEINVPFANCPIQNVSPLREDEYVPRGSTAMLDAVKVGIDRLREADDSDVKANIGYLVVVISDGYENASKTINRAQLASLIKELQASDKWTFTYMLSNQDLTIVKDLGVSLGNATLYVSNNIGTKNAFTTMADSTLGYMTLRESGVTTSTSFYNNDDVNTNATTTKGGK